MPTLLMGRRVRDPEGQEPSSTCVAPASQPGVGDRHARVVAVDVLRGAALVGMLAYHAAWDLHALGLSDVDPARHVALQWGGHAVAAVFLFLSGVSLQLSVRGGRGWRQHALRLATLALAAGAVTLVTWTVLPGSPVRFGILHCLVVTNVIALWMRRWSNRTLLVAAAACLIAPFAMPWRLGADWAWVGISDAIPTTLDFRPVLPWLGVVLLGSLAARTRLILRLGSQRPRTGVVRAVAAAGRHSLGIYLVHQPLLFGMLCLAASAAGSLGSPGSILAPAEAAAFVKACESECITHGGDGALCRSTCHCVLTASAGRGRERFDAFARLKSARAAISEALKACTAYPAPPRRLD